MGNIQSKARMAQENVQIFLVNSSTKVRKYILPPRDGLSKGPHMSEWTILRGCLALCGAIVLKAFLGCLPIKHHSQVFCGE